MEATIEVAGLRKRFGPTLALNGMSFTVRHGQVTGFFPDPGARVSPASSGTHPRSVGSHAGGPDRLTQIVKSLFPGLALAVRSHIRTKLGVSRPSAVFILLDGHRHQDCHDRPLLSRRVISGYRNVGRSHGAARVRHPVAPRRGRATADHEPARDPSCHPRSPEGARARSRRWGEPDCQLS